jgi:regulator of nucleoside diphosphate kinase
MRYERYLSQHDAGLLGELAETLMRVRDVKFNTGEKLVEMIASSAILAADVMSCDCVGLGSEVTYRPVGAQETNTIAIVFPEQANRSLSRVSILAPIALALIGRKVNSIVEVEMAFSQVMFVQLMSVRRMLASGCLGPSTALTEEAG